LLANRVNKEQVNLEESKQEEADRRKEKA